MTASKRRPSISILDGAATLTRPTPAFPHWRITWRDHVTGKRRQTTAPTREEAEAKAADLLGIYSPTATATTTAPTLEEVVTSWMNANTHRWSSRTPAMYHYITAKYRESLGEIPINKITPAMLTNIDISHLSRERQKQVRTVMRGIFTHADTWTRAPAETYAQAIGVKGTKSDDLTEEVARGDIAPLAYINNLLLCAYNTAQNGDDLPAYSTLSDLTGHKSAPERPIRRGFHTGHGDVIYRLGFPAPLIDSHKRGRPRHYSNTEEQQRKTVADVASLYRRYALIVALGAGAGLRIGETLALRVHHILDPQTIRNLVEWSDLDQDHYAEISQCGWTGTIHVDEQVSKDSAGYLRVSRPKMNRTRITTLPPFLPARDYAPINYDALTAHPTEIPRIEAMQHWYTTGAAPVSMMLFDRLAEILAPIVEQYHHHGDLRQAVDDLSASMLFPTRNPPRAKTHYPARWNGITGPDPITSGGYIGADNLNRTLNPLYDHVSDMMNIYPQHRASRKGRRGWTYHAFRHFAASTRLMILPATQVAAELGHKDAGFTLKRYGHAITERPTTAFRY